MSNSYTPDEVTFALYFDRELDSEEEAKFEAALNADSELLAQYHLFVETHEHVYAHFEALETSYPLEGFSDRVMNDIPEEAPWVQGSTIERAAQSMEQNESSWFKRILIPIFIGTLTAAAILILVSRNDRLASEQPGVSADRPETQLIDHKVTWLESDEDDDLIDSEESEESEESETEGDGI